MAYAILSLVLIGALSATVGSYVSEEAGWATLSLLSGGWNVLFVFGGGSKPGKNRDWMHR